MVEDTREKMGSFGLGVVPLPSRLIPLMLGDEIKVEHGMLSCWDNDVFD